jgi:hypothetical protein
MREDPKLAAFLQTVEEEVRDMTDEHAIVKRLSALVAARLGGDREDIVAAVEAELTRLMNVGGGTRVVHIGEMQAG